jgi:tRNA A-37 threonylcarbamoyl transferase component Bud32
VLLAEALETAKALYGSTEAHDDRWFVGKEVRTRSSMLVHLRLPLADRSQVFAYYKVYDERHGSKAATRLARSAELTNALALLCEGEGITVPRVLAVRPEASTIVTSGVPGRPLGSMVNHSLTRGRRRSASDVYRKIGRAVHLIETATLPDEPVSDLAQWDGTDEALTTARGFLPPVEWRWLRAQLVESYEAARADAEGMFAHGDLGGGNVLLSADGIGLVDFQWQVRWKGYDLATVACRSFHHPAVTERWGSALIHALLEGYGDHGVTSSPAWRFYTLRRTLRFAVKRPTRWAHGRRTSRARQQLREQALLS